MSDGVRPTAPVYIVLSPPHLLPFIDGKMCLKAAQNLADKDRLSNNEPRLLTAISIAAV